MSAQTSSSAPVSADQTSGLEQRTQSTLDTVDEPLGGVSLKGLKDTYCLTRKANDAWRNRIAFASRKGEMNQLKEFNHWLSLGLQDEERQVKDITLLFPDDPISKHQIGEQQRKRKRERDVQVATLTENRKRLCGMFDKTVELAALHEQTMRDHALMIRINQRAVAKQSTFNQKLIDMIEKQEVEDATLIATLMKE